ncbi:MAG: hypothetical protein HY220_02740 [Candidatus Sungbacteria bacterium]|uniref:Uncharacterized protein n=1 Tax=Candidatus Sungiibacteriota bacterium TaxID=2750080 RepID=A0A9D6QU62_9BACT|nr:hypothetical protein [Candidatus Sungbacteria bacterium]
MLEKLIRFYKKPATLREKEIANLMTDFLEAYNRRDIGHIIASFEEGAFVDSLTVNKRVGTEEYSVILSNTLSNLKTAKMDNAVIRASEDEATVQGIFEIIQQNDTRASNMYRVHYHRGKDGAWKITDVLYLTRYRPRPI